VDARTRAVYERRADEWAARRRAHRVDVARALASAARGPSIDLGCGPGWHAPSLPAPVVAMDGARSMLDLAGVHAPAALRVQGDLEALPFRPSSFGAAWARNSYVHLPRVRVPMALAELHRAVQVGGRVELFLFLGDEEGHDLFADDDFRDRFFSLWDRDRLLDVVAGAGFDTDDVESTDATGDGIHLTLSRARTLPDVVDADMRLLVCGLNPSLYAADAGIGFARPGNRFWPAALDAGIVTRDRDPWYALRADHIGFTDLVKRATVGADELTSDEYRAGHARVARLVHWLQPRAVVFVGLAGWRAAVDRRAAAGVQDATIGGRPVYVMPSTSGLNARIPKDELAEHLRRAVALA